MSDVLPELIIEIFSHLPVKSLLRFRCVSKQYRALIDSPNFINSQLLKSNSKSCLIYCNMLAIYSVDFAFLNKPVLLSHPLQNVSRDFSLRLVASCNGLVCLISEREPQIVIWNPSTRKHRKLPVPKTVNNPVYSRNFVVYGFGYDRVNDDYKLVRFIKFYIELGFRVQIYSLKSDSWRDLNDCPGNFATGYASALSNVFVDDSLHWLVDNDGPGIVQISAFHLGIEEYRVVQLPDCRFFDMNCVTNMGNLRGKLCLLSGYDKSSLDIWVMNSYGIKESWTKLFSLAQHLYYRSSHFLKAFTYSEDGNQVILHQAGGEKLLWCDIRQRTGEAKEIHGIPRFWQFFQHVESLVKLPNDSSTKNRDDSLSKRFKTVVLIK